MQRLFIGIALPDIYQQRLKPLTEELGSRLKSKVRWTRPGIWHLTLKFLGDVDDAKIPAIMSSLDEIRFSPFELRSGSCDCFPNKRRPRVVWLSVQKGARPCQELAGSIDDAMARLGFEAETREFVPHMTLGRVKQAGHDDWSARLADCKTEGWPSFRVDRFVLWSSELSPTGAVHTPVKEFVMED